MLNHQPMSILLVEGYQDSSLNSFVAYLHGMPHLHITIQSQLPDDLSPYNVIITNTIKTLENTTPHLIKFIHACGGWLHLAQSSEDSLPEIFGVKPEPLGSASELRVLFEDSSHPLAVRLPDAFYINDQFQLLTSISDDTETVLYADWRYTHRPVLTQRRVGEKGHVACTTLQAFDHPVYQQILYRVLRQLAGQPMNAKPLGVGLLGYAISVGKIHGLGVNLTPGLELRAVCDVNPERLKQACQDFPDVKTYETESALAGDPDINVVIVSTAPDIHSKLCLSMMKEGKHVVCEKPLALNQKETTAMVEMAEKQGVHLGCYQNRRWDIDYLAIKQALVEGRIGDLFHLETFVGGFQHPCGFWHSHESISGGTAYDWGAHYLDWIVSLIPDRIKAVISTRHKRVWHDVTNADQERVQIRFAGGQEAEFMHSDIAAVRKPKWYLLGTQGAIIGNWHDVTSYEVDPVLYFHAHDIPATEMPPDLTLYSRHDTGQLVPQKLATPQRRHYVFYHNLADHLVFGEPVTAPLEDSVKVVAILEAAARSSAHGGTVEVFDG